MLLLFCFKIFCSTGTEGRRIFQAFFRHLYMESWHCDSSNWPIWTQKVPNEALFNGLFCSTIFQAFLYGIMALSSIVVYDMLNQFDAESLTSFTILSTPLMCLIILKEPLRIWKFMLIPLILMAIIVITKPPVLFRLIFPATATLNHEEENGIYTRPLTN